MDKQRALMSCKHNQLLQNSWNKNNAMEKIHQTK